jgi:hypothetical protein
VLAGLRSDRTEERTVKEPATRRSPDPSARGAPGLHYDPDVLSIKILVGVENGQPDHDRRYHGHRSVLCGMTPVSAAPGTD